jgi:hypothetical protein
MLAVVIARLLAPTAALDYSDGIDENESATRFFA